MYLWHVLHEIYLSVSIDAISGETTKRGLEVTVKQRLETYSHADILLSMEATNLKFLHKSRRDHETFTIHLTR